MFARNHRNTTLFRSAAAGLAIAGLASGLQAGPISPPAGPVAATGKTTQEIYDKVAQGAAAAEPRLAINAVNTPGNGSGTYAITQPGAYYLAGSLTPAGTNTVIYISADDVSIDLHGFRIAPQTNNYPTIRSIAARTRVINGSIKGGSTGLALGASGSAANLNIDGCSSSGLTTLDGATIADCTIRACGGSGIVLGDNSIAERCTVKGCNLVGIRTDVDCRLVSCAASGNNGIGFQLDGVAEGCVASGNTAKGFVAAGGSMLDRCTAQNNTTAGFALSAASVATRCISTNNNTTGFELSASNCSIIECTASANAVYQVRLSGEGQSVTGCSLAGVSGFPVIHHDQGWGVRIERNTIIRGTYGIDGGNQGCILATGNNFYGQSTSAIGLPLVYPHSIGTMYSSGGEVTTNNPWVNFYR